MNLFDRSLPALTRCSPVSFRRQRRMAASCLALLFVCLLALNGCGAPASGSSAASVGKVLNVVATVNFWGSIAQQLGGVHVAVTSIVTSPTGDPHDYEPTTSNARAIATADYVVENGAGYDGWSDKLMSANPFPGRKVLTAAQVVGENIPGYNPHIWYNPAYVEKISRAITADYQALDPADAGYFTRLHAAFEQAVQPYRQTIATIKAKYTGVPVGASESICIFLAQATGLDLITPLAYMKAENDGTDPPAASVAEFNQQITRHQIKVFLLNVQTISNATRSLQSSLAQSGIPVVEISETIRPVNATFEQWQLSQLQALQKAFARAVPNI